MKRLVLAVVTLLLPAVSVRAEASSPPPPAVSTAQPRPDITPSAPVAADNLVPARTGLSTEETVRYRQLASASAPQTDDKAAGAMDKTTMILIGVVVVAVIIVAASGGGGSGGY